MTGCAQKEEEARLREVLRGRHGQAPGEESKPKARPMGANRRACFFAFGNFGRFPSEETLMGRVLPGFRPRHPELYHTPFRRTSANRAFWAKRLRTAFGLQDGHFQVSSDGCQRKSKRRANGTGRTVPPGAKLAVAREIARGARPAGRMVQNSPWRVRLPAAQGPPGGRRKTRLCQNIGM